MRTQVDRVNEDDAARPGASLNKTDVVDLDTDLISAKPGQDIALEGNELRDAALAYARMGYSVIPLKPGSKSPLVKWTPYQERTASEDEVARWWDEWPDANIGLVTGAVSGIVVLDIDGEAGTRLLEERGWSVEATPHARTAKGFHYYYEHPGTQVRNFARSVGEQTLDDIDFRGDGGYIVAPPSRHESGRTYEWLVSPSECKPAILPAWLLDLLSSNGQTGRNTTHEPGVIREGGRNTELTRVAGRFRREGLNEATIAAALLAYNQEHCEPPLAEREVRSIAQSVSRYAPGGGGLRYPLTDAGNAERLVAVYGENLRYLHSRKKWLHYDGSRWVTDDNGEAERRMLDTVRLIQFEADGIEDKDFADKVRKFALASERKERLAAGLVVAQSMLPISQDKLDVDPMVFNVVNGTIDLATGELRKHRREDHLSRKAPVIFDPDAHAPRWERFLSEVLPDPELVSFVQRAMGYSLSGSTEEHVFFLLLGAGRNGKSTFLNAIGRLLGDYAKTTGPDTLLDTGRGRPTNDIAGLAGRRFVTTFEPDRGSHLSESLIKQLTGGDPVSARFLYGEFFTYTPQMKVFMSANHRPPVREGGLALWERVRVVPFDTYIEPEARDRQLSSVLARESSGILNWLIEGCLAWQREGLGYPPAVANAVSTYELTGDRLSGFLAQECVTHPDGRESKGEFRKAYVEWCNAHAVEPLGDPELRAALLAKGCGQGRTSSQRYWSGLRLRSDQDIQ